jgi:hypothetical protein
MIHATRRGNTGQPRCASDGNMRWSTLFEKKSEYSSGVIKRSVKDLFQDFRTFFPSFDLRQSCRQLTLSRNPREETQSSHRISVSDSNSRNLISHFFRFSEQSPITPNITVEVFGARTTHFWLPWLYSPLGRDPSFTLLVLSDFRKCFNCSLFFFATHELISSVPHSKITFPPQSLPSTNNPSHSHPILSIFIFFPKNTKLFLFLWVYCHISIFWALSYPKRPCQTATILKWLNSLSPL